MKSKQQLLDKAEELRREARSVSNSAEYNRLRAIAAILVTAAEDRAAFNIAAAWVISGDA